MLATIVVSRAGESRGGGGAFQAHAPPPLLVQMWVYPNRKMNMHVKCAPPSHFELEVGVVVVVRKRNETEVCVKKNVEM